MRKNKSALISVIKRLAEPTNRMSVSSASLICGYSQTQIRKVLKNFLVFGDSVFIHRNSGRKPITTVSANDRKKIVSLYKKRFDGYNFTFFAKMLREIYEIFHSDKTIYNILTESGIESPECRRKTKEEKAHRIRPRRAHEGEMLQIDATPYQWFKWANDTRYYSLHGSIDDATGKITALYMCENECLFGYAELVRRTFYNFDGGHPAAIYSDRAAIFCVTPRNKNDLTIQEQLAGLHEKRTQWQRMMDELGVEQILAWSPQAKGRVERMWKTIQGRLPWYFEHKNIQSLEEANRFLLDYVNIFNNEFAVEPAEKMKVWHKTGLDPDYVLCARYERTVHNSEYFSFEGYRWRIIGAHFRKTKFELCVNEHGIKAWKDGQFYDVELIDDFYDAKTQVLENIIYKYLLKDMKEIAA